MALVIDLAQSPEQREAVYRLRYAVYPEEMHLFCSIADKERGLLKDSDDDSARVVYAALDGEIAGAMRLHFGCDPGFPARFPQLYELDTFARFVPREKMAVLTRFTVAAKHRGGRIPFGLMKFVYEYCVRQGMEIGFCDCVPHLLHLYVKLGWRRYLGKTISDPEFGIEIPLCMISRDLGHFEAVGSPLAGSCRRLYAGQEALPCLEALEGTVSCGRLTQEASEESWGQIFKILVDHGKTTVFDGLSERVVDDLIAQGDILECTGGQSIIRAGTVYQNIFLILEGKVEVRLGSLVIAVLSEGDIFGEMAFLLHSERSCDVVAVTDTVRVLSLGEQVLHRLMHGDAELASRLLFNISRILCLRLVALHHMLEK
jgi:hypothetical protein